MSDDRKAYPIDQPNVRNNGGELKAAYMPGTISIADIKPSSFVFSGGGEPVVIFRPDGTFEFPKGETREAAKVFWDYVEQYMAESYRRHAASIRTGE